jgi:ankyrin repeat protein
MKCISSKDMQGSTPLHSCCSSGCEPVLRFLILHATGNLSTSSKLSISSSLTRKKLLNSCEIVSTGTPTVLYSKNAVWFASDSLYDSNSGEELVQSTNAAVQSSSHRTLLTPPLKIVSLSDPRLYIYKSTSSKKKDILSKTGSSLVEPAKYTVDYDVVIPWVMRNMLRKANAMGEKLGASAVDILKEIIETIDSHNSNTLLPHEVSEMLNYFGIMVTKDIVKELCCLYPSSLDDIDEKWELMQDIHGINFVKQYRAHAKTESHDEDFEESKGWKGLRRDSKSSQRNSRIVSNPNDDEDDDEEAKAESKGNERSHMQTSKSIRRNDKILQSIDVSDENFGLDINMMLDDLVSKRSFKTTTLRKTSDEDEEEMPIENEDDKTDMLESRSRKIPSMNEKALLPSAVTVSYIKRLRRQLVNPQDSNGYSPLMVAAALGNIAHIEFLIHHGGDVSLTAYDGNSALSVAKDASVSSLLQKQLLDWLRKCKSNMVRRGICETTGGADNSTGKWGSTSKGFSSEALEKISDSQLLHFDKTNASTLIQDACAHDITLLHSQLKSLESNRYDFCRTSLSRAISAGLVMSVKHILDMGMTPNTADICGRRALHVCVEVASQVGMASTCELSRLDEYIQVLLSLRSLTEDLLHKGADVNAITVSGRTALHELFCKGSDIISISASTSVSRGSYERRILDKSLCHVKSLIVRTLVQWGADPTTLDRHGYCPIHYCARENMVDCMVEILKNSKIKSSLIYVTDMRGRTPLHIACQMNSPEVALVICKWDGDSSVGVLGVADKSGKVPLDLLHPNMNAIHLMTIWKACRNGLIDK